jgi:membrane-associated phospholipid phosphatase
MYLGVHSLNQVFFGLLMGAWFALSGHFILKGIVFKMVKNMIDGKHTGLF